MITDADLAQAVVVFVAVTSAATFAVRLWHRFAPARNHCPATAPEPAEAAEDPCRSATVWLQNSP